MMIRMAFADREEAAAIAKQATVRARRRRQAKTGTTHVLISPMRLVISATSPRSPHHFDGSEKPSGSGGGKPLAVASLVVSATIASTSLASVSASDCSGDGGSRQAAARARARRSSDSATTRARERDGRTDWTHPAAPEAVDGVRPLVALLRAAGLPVDVDLVVRLGGREAQHALVRHHDLRRPVALLDARRVGSVHPAGCRSDSRSASRARSGERGLYSVGWWLEPTQRA